MLLTVGEDKFVSVLGNQVASTDGQIISERMLSDGLDTCSVASSFDGELFDDALIQTPRCSPLQRHPHLLTHTLTLTV